MATRAEIEVSGAAEIARKLDPVRFRQAFEVAARFALEPVLETARVLAPRGKTLRLSRGLEIGLPGRRTQRLGSSQVILGSKARYAHLVESGHRIVARGPAKRPGEKRRRRGRQFGSAFEGLLATRGQVPAYPFAKPAFEQRQAEVIQRFEQMLRLELGLGTTL